MRTNENSEIRSGSTLRKSSRNMTKLTPQRTYKRYTKDQDDLILQLVDQHGRKWSKIVRYFPGKSRKMIRNRYLRIMAKYEKQLYSSQDPDKSNLQTSECEGGGDGTCSMDSSEIINTWEYYKTQEQHIQTLINQTQEYIFLQLVQKNYPHLYPYCRPSYHKEMTPADIEELVKNLLSTQSL